MSPATVTHAATDPDPTPDAPLAVSVAEIDSERDESGSTNRPPGNGWTAGRIALGTIAAVLLLAVLYYAVTFFQVWSTGRSDQARPVDAIVVMGAAQYDGRPSPQLEARLDQVLELWPEGYAPIVVATGGNIPGDRFTEAESSATYLAAAGVPASAILQENEGASTYESLQNVAELLDERGLSSVLIVTDPYHALRARMIAAEVGLDAHVSPTGTSVVTGRTSLTRHLEEAAGISVGRIIGFDRLTSFTD